jgi:SAM-dependent methyltransferase
MTLKLCETLEEVKAYLSKDYWESGKTKKCSGYENEIIDWWWYLRWFQCFNKVIPLRDKSILDLGCALGSFVAVALAAGGADAHGIDLSGYAIEKGCQLFPSIDSRTHEGSIHDLSRFEDKRFDVLYSNQVFEHLPKQHTDEMIKEITRVARPGALLWAGLVLGNKRNDTDPDLTHINIHLREWWDRKFIANGWLIDYLTDQELRKTTAGPDKPGYSFFKKYDWHSICYRRK